MKTLALALAVFVLSLSLGLYGSQNFVSQNQLAGLASLTSTSLFDDYDDLSYVDSASLVNVTHDTQSAEKAITYTAAAPATGGEIDPASPLGQGLIGLWHLNGNAIDVLGIHNGVVRGNAVFDVGKYGQGMLLDATGDTVNLGEITETVGVSDLAVSAWVKSNVADGPLVVRNIINKDRSGFLQWTLAEYGDEQFNFSINNGTNTYNVFSDSSFRDTDWHNVVGVFGAGTMQIYVDGLARDSTPPTGISGTIRSDYRHVVCIGSEAHNCDNPAVSSFNGAIDDVAIWNRALSPTEVSQLASAGGAPVPTTGSFQSANLNSGSLAS